MGLLSWLKLKRRTDDDEIQAEIRAHIAIATREKMADGARQQDAHYAALKEFGNVTLAREATRRVWTPWWVDAVHDHVSDLRYAVRALAKNPVFSLTVIAVLTLGIGVNAAVFTLLKGMALAPIGGVEGSWKLTVLFAETSTGRPQRVSYPDYQYLRDHDTAFSQLFGSSLVTTTLGKGRNARQVWAEMVTGNYFQGLAVRAARGRTLLPSDEAAPGRHPVVVISHAMWTRDFAADPEIVGKTIELNHVLFTVVGVAEPAFHGTIVSYDIDAFIPIMMAGQLGVDGGLPRAAPSEPFPSGQPSPEALFTDRRAAVVFPHGYLKPGVSLSRAAAQTDAIWATLTRDRPFTDATQQIRIVPFWRSPTGGQTYMLPTLVVLGAMAPLVLMIACANIAGLVLVRGVSRRGEIAVRLALGATRTRIVRLLVVENLVLAVPGAILGVLLAWRAIPLLVGYADAMASPQRLFFNIAVDRLVIAFSAIVACASVVVFAFVPALQISRVDLVSAINEDASPRGAARGRLRAGLVVAQVAVSLLLLVGAGLVSRSFEAARRANPGFDQDQVTAIALDVRQNGYDEPRGRVFYRKLLDTLRADAGIESATLAASHPLNVIGTRGQRAVVEGYEPRRGEDVAFEANTVASDYFRTLRIPMMAGRPFEDGDDDTGAPVVVVNHTLAQRFWGSDANAIGKRMRVNGEEWRTVVGVAADVKYSMITERPRPYLYLPFFQAYRSTMIVHTRGPSPVAMLIDQTRARIASLDSDLPLLYVRSLAERTSGSLIFFRFAATMLFLFGTAGMVLAAMGTYGLVSYAVKQSTHEIGIRMALGASATSVIRAFVGRGLRLGLVGAAVGVAAAFALTGMLRSVLFGVSATDAATFAQSLAIVIGGVLLATVIPAWRAARTNPLSALRHQ